MDSNAAISAMNVMVGQKVDGIAIVVPDQQIGPQVIDMAAQAKISLVAVDDPIKSGAGEAAAFVGFDGFDMGSKVGEEAGKLFKASGWNIDDVRVIAAYEQQLSVCQDREAGEEAAFQKVVGALPKIIKVGTDNSTMDAQNRTGAVVTANPNVKHWVAWACNDENLIGVTTALANAGMPAENVIGVGLGLTSLAKTGRQARRPETRPRSISAAAMSATPPCACSWRRSGITSRCPPKRSRIPPS